MKILLKRFGSSYEFVCSYRAKEHDEIFAGLPNGNYTIARIKGGVIHSGGRQSLNLVSSEKEHLENVGAQFEKFQAGLNQTGSNHASVQVVKQINQEKNIQDIATNKKWTIEALIEATNTQSSTIEDRVGYLTILGVTVTQEDLFSAKNSHIDTAETGPNKDKPIGRLVTIHGKRYCMNADLTLDDWNVVKAKDVVSVSKDIVIESKTVTESKDLVKTAPVKTGIAKPESVADQINKALKDKQEIKLSTNATITMTKKELSTDEMLAQLDFIENGGKVDPVQKKPTVKVKTQVEQAKKLPEIKDFDEDSAFAELSAGLADLDSLDGQDLGLSSLDSISESPIIEEQNDGQDTQDNNSKINKQSDNSDNSVIVEDDGLTVTCRYDGSIYRKKFKSDVVAKRNATSIASMMDDSSSIRDILEGPATLYSKVG